MDNWEKFTIALAIFWVLCVFAMLAGMVYVAIHFLMRVW
jgi:hypothetical protein